MVVKASEIIDSLELWVNVQNYDITMQNFFIEEWEMDLFLMKQSWYVYEYEIKISRADFFNDFKKGDKHKQLKLWERACNKFYFVVPENLIHINEIPNEYGLLYYYPETGRFKDIKKAKILHKKKIGDDNNFQKYLIKKMAFRDTLSRMKIKNLNKKINKLKIQKK